MLIFCRRPFLILLFSVFLAQILPFATKSKEAFAETRREEERRDNSSIAQSTKPTQRKDIRQKITFLYHMDPDIRSRTILEIVELRDSSLTDDLIRAFSVEYFTPVNLVYEKALSVLTGMKNIREKYAWKSWLATEVRTGRLNIDYIPVDVNSLDLKERMQIQSLAFRLDAEYFKEMTKALTTGEDDRRKFNDAFRYMVANDHRIEVQQFLSGNWLRNLFQTRDIDINLIAYYLNGLANPGPLRDRIDANIRTFLESEDPVVIANALHLLAGKDGSGAFLTVSDVEEKIKQHLNSPDQEVALQAKRAMQKVHPGWGVSYEEAFIDLHQMIGRRYPFFKLKGIDWEAVGNTFFPRIKRVSNDEEFGLLCMELMAQLQDSHAYLLDDSAKVPTLSFPYWDLGFVCLEDDQGRPVVYHVIYGSPAWKAGMEIGMVVLRINDEDAKDGIERVMNRRKKYIGYSSSRYLRYHGYRFFQCQMEKGTAVKLEVLDRKDKLCHFELPATLRIPYQPRLPVPKDGINDSAGVSWKMLDDRIGYIYVRRIKNNLIELLDEAVGELRNAAGLIIDVRGNSGGGFDRKRSHVNFSLDNESFEPERPRFKGPVALLIDSRCISAGEGWASWFIAHRRARVFGEATAGASARKIKYKLKNALYHAYFPEMAYKGYLDRPIEHRGLEPDVPVVQNREDLIRKRDTVLERAREYLLQVAQ